MVSWIGFVVEHGASSATPAPNTPQLEAYGLQLRIWAEFMDELKHIHARHLQASCALKYQIVALLDDIAQRYVVWSDVWYLLWIRN